MCEQDGMEHRAVLQIRWAVWWEGLGKVMTAAGTPDCRLLRG